MISLAEMSNVYNFESISKPLRFFDTLCHTEYHKERYSFTIYIYIYTLIHNTRPNRN